MEHRLRRKSRPKHYHTITCKMQLNTIGKNITIIATSIYVIYIQATHARAAEVNSTIEKLNCGRLGIIMVRSSMAYFLDRVGHTVSRSTITIPRRDLRVNGVMHYFMGGNDRTFTKLSTDNFRAIEETNKKNPVMLRLKSGNFLYGKKREEATISLIGEIYTCVFERD